ncbi:UBP13 [Symbiodinium sp. KB8]|nr:UBP13 [Symbiodinium sp. KB8]
MSSWQFLEWTGLAFGKLLCFEDCCTSCCDQDEVIVENVARCGDVTSDVSLLARVPDEQLCQVVVEESSTPSTACPSEACASAASSTSEAVEISWELSGDSAPSPAFKPGWALVVLGIAWFFETRICDFNADLLQHVCHLQGLICEAFCNIYGNGEPLDILEQFLKKSRSYRKVSGEYSFQDVEGRDAETPATWRATLTIQHWGTFTGATCDNKKSARHSAAAQFLGTADVMNAWAQLCTSAKAKEVSDEHQSLDLARKWKETGYVGLAWNHGATPTWRVLVLHGHGEALQNVFYRLQTSKQAVNCMELTESFGWDAEDPFIQHDVQELNRIFCDRLEEQMENTESAGSIKRLFEGEMENHVECLDVDYTSSRRETFYDIQLSLKSDKGNDLQTLEESLAEFTAEEILDGENLYKAGDYCEQRAKKGIRFVKLPPVLTFQLKRFHFDLQKMEMVKLDSRFEFPRRLDLSKFMPHAGPETKNFATAPQVPVQKSLV